MERAAAAPGQRVGPGRRVRDMWLLCLVLGSVEGQLIPESNRTRCNIPGNFMCSSGDCIPGSWQCDGVPDCTDGSDEEECHKYIKPRRAAPLRTAKAKSKCGPKFFPCASGIHCIIGRFQCNGFEDCPDGSDEENCTSHPLLCSSSRFHCNNKMCIDTSFVCNGKNNCRDNSDEKHCPNSQEGASEQEYVSSEIQLLYYPSITYTIIGSSVIFVLVVALLALVLHHQRKRTNLMSLPVHRLQHPLLLSRLVVLDHPHSCRVTYNVNSGVHYVSSEGYQPPVSIESPPPYTEAVLDDSSCPPWFSLPPPPYSSDIETSSQTDLPPYRSRSGSATTSTGNTLDTPSSSWESASPSEAPDTASSPSDSQLNTALEV